MNAAIDMGLGGEVEDRIALVGNRGEYSLFGRRINASEAAVILRHLSREVSVRPERLRRS